MSADESLPPMTPAEITARKLQDLVSIWAMLTELPRSALLEQVMTMYGFDDPEDATPESLQAAGKYVLYLNAELFKKGRQVGRSAIREYQANMQGEPQEPELVTAFWRQFDLLNAKHGPTEELGWLNHSRTPGLIAINFKQYIEACRDHGQPAPDMARLRKLLPESYPRRFVASNRCVYSRHANKTTKCWIFQEACRSGKED